MHFLILHAQNKRLDEDQLLDVAADVFFSTASPSAVDEVGASFTDGFTFDFGRLCPGYVGTMSEANCHGKPRDENLSLVLVGEEFLKVVSDFTLAKVLKDLEPKLHTAFKPVTAYEKLLGALGYVYAIYKLKPTTFIKSSDPDLRAVLFRYETTTSHILKCDSHILGKSRLKLVED